MPRQLDDESPLARGVAWVDTMQQKGGHGGPVIHYWGGSFHYIGPRRDWRVEGLLATLTTLSEQSPSTAEKWMDKAKWLGMQVVENQRKDGSYIISDFEQVPSFWHAAQPHECAVDNGLLILSEKLEKNNSKQSEIFLDAAGKNIKDVLVGNFWNMHEGSFQQYQIGQYDRAPNLFVPNKIATACEALVRLEDQTGKKEYLEYAEQAAQKIIELQAEGEYAGGIFQSNTREQIITLYTARCVRPLLLLGEATKQAKFTRAAKRAAQFIARMQHESGAFNFGVDAGGVRTRFPHFVAGSGEMLSALHAVGGFGPQVKRGTKWLLSHQHPNGGFASFEGILQKNTHDSVLQGVSWMDELPVVGWNDKALRFLAESNTVTSSDKQERLWEKTCDDGIIKEDTQSIQISGASNHYFDKKAHFDKSSLALVKESFLRLAVRQNPIMRSIGSMGFRLSVGW